MTKELFDVVAVDLETSVVRVIASNKTKLNAEAIVMMAVGRRGGDDEFFSEVPAGTYANGSKWEGINK